MREELKKINDREDKKDGKFVLYCMEVSQREDFNHSLEFAIEKANSLSKPVIVAFFITDKYRYSNQRYYRFMLEGILKTKEKVEKKRNKIYNKKTEFHRRMPGYW